LSRRSARDFKSSGGRRATTSRSTRAGLQLMRTRGNGPPGDVSHCNPTSFCRMSHPRRPRCCRKGLSGRPTHRPFRDLLGVHSRYGLHTRAVTVYRDTLIGTSIAAPFAPGLSRCLGGICTRWKGAALSRRAPILVIGGHFWCDAQYGPHSKMW
jgi:hypothetical protein